jgi:hypothetical protein
MARLFAAGGLIWWFSICGSTRRRPPAPFIEEAEMQALRPLKEASTRPGSLRTFLGTIGLGIAVVVVSTGGLAAPLLVGLGAGGGGTVILGFATAAGW